MNDNNQHNHDYVVSSTEKTQLKGDRCWEFLTLGHPLPQNLPPLPVLAPRRGSRCSRRWRHPPRRRWAVACGDKSVVACSLNCPVTSMAVTRQGWEIPREIHKKRDLGTWWPTSLRLHFVNVGFKVAPMIFDFWRKPRKLCYLSPVPTNWICGTFNFCPERVVGTVANLTLTARQVNL